MGLGEFLLWKFLPAVIGNFLSRWVKVYMPGGLLSHLIGMAVAFTLLVLFLGDPGWGAPLWLGFVMLVVASSIIPALDLGAQLSRKPE